MNQHHVDSLKKHLIDITLAIQKYLDNEGTYQKYVEMHYRYIRAHGELHPGQEDNQKAQEEVNREYRR